MAPSSAFVRYAACEIRGQAAETGAELAARLNLGSNISYAVGLLRALLGAMIFALPLTMTNEMWDLGVTMEPLRLALLLALTFPLLVALSFYAGFEATFSLRDNVLDAFAAITVSTISCGAVLGLFGIIGTLAVLSFGASVGALLADKQFNDSGTEKEDKAGPGFGGRMFVMAVGAIFLSLNVAPTNEVEIIASNIDPLQAVGLLCASFLALGLVLAMADPGNGNVSWVCRVRRAFAGYGMCLLLAGFILWCFGRYDGLALGEAVECAIVLGFPAALGAGAARLILGNGGDEQDA
jgi:putative integral membrane protein (TIGR02587 family)